MCDTVFAPASATADGVAIFGKNSDREPNEAHHLLRVPRARHDPGSTVQCTYSAIPQVEATYEVLLAKPCWIWGAEMGANEHGVVIGNEAVFTRLPYDKTPGLVGMDLLRLALERAATARTALDVITGLLAAHGQGGNCGFQQPLYYHNSFLIADAHDAWVLETAGPHWAAEQVRGVRTISNAITIGAEWDLASDDLVTYAVERGWCKGRDDFHFGRCYSDFLYTRFSDARRRQFCTTQTLLQRQGAITVQGVMAALRSHGLAAGDDWTPAHGLTGAEVCMHAGPGPVRGSQTTGSMVSYLAPGAATHFLTATAAPCTSIFKPVWTGVDLPDSGPQPDGTYNAAALFWRHERLHRATLPGYAARIRCYAPERDALESEFVAGALHQRAAPPEDRAAYSVACFARADDAESRWLGQVQAAGQPAQRRLLYNRAWRGFNRAARMPDPV